MGVGAKRDRKGRTPRADGDGEPWYTGCIFVSTPALSIPKTWDLGCAYTPGISTHCLPGQSKDFGRRRASPPTLPTLRHFKGTFLIPLLVLLASHGHTGVLGMDMDRCG